jgi:hypothetical protein
MNPADAEIQERVDRLFDRFERMTDAEFVLMRSVWEEQDPTIRQNAWISVKDLVKRQRREGMLNDARNRIASWVNNYPPRGTFPDATGAMSLSGMDQASVRHEAIPPMLDSIAATIAGPQLDEDERSALMAPFTGLSQGMAADE